jgi:Zn-dependent membrane protease YugP
VHLDALGGKTSLPVAAHELGHAAGYAKPLGRAIFRSRLGSLASTPAVVSASLGDPDSKLSRLAAPAVALGMVPTLLDEALASKRGLKQLKGMQSPEAYRASRKVLGRAWGTYAATAAGLGLTTEGTRRFRSWYKKHQLRD